MFFDYRKPSKYDIDSRIDKYGFNIKKRHLIFTEPFKKNRLSDPKKIWPIVLDQNIWAEK